MKNNSNQGKLYIKIELADRRISFFSAKIHFRYQSQENGTNLTMLIPPWSHYERPSNCFSWRTGHYGQISGPNQIKNCPAWEYTDISFLSATSTILPSYESVEEKYLEELLIALWPRE